VKLILDLSTLLGSDLRGAECKAEFCDRSVGNPAGVLAICSRPRGSTALDRAKTSKSSDVGSVL